MVRFAILLSFFFVFAKYATAQDLRRTVKWPEGKKSLVQWQDDPEDKRSKRTYLRFESNVDYPNQVTLLPYYSETIPISSSIADVSQLSVYTFNNRYEPLQVDEISIVEKLPVDLIVDQKESFNVYKSRRKSYLQISIPTIWMNQSTGQFEKLVEFSVKIEEGSGIGISKLNYNVANTSILADGEWKMIQVDKSGIYRISYEELQSMGLSDLNNVSIWGLGGSQLPYWNNQTAGDDLVQLPLLMEKGSDGTFNQNDYILFYAQGPVTWQFDEDESQFVHSIHGFAEQISYFITTSKSNPQRVPSQSQPQESYTRASNAYDALVYFEQNDTNLIKSGREWFGESFDIYTNREFNTGLNLPITGGEAKVRVRTAARSSASSSYTLRSSGTNVGNISHSSVNVNDQYTNYASIGERSFAFPYSQGELKLDLTYNKPTPAAKGWLDFITVNARQKMVMGQSQLLFRDIESKGIGEITQFTIENTTASLMVWDVTDLFNPVNLEYSDQGNTAQFKISTEVLREFVAFKPEQVFKVNVVGDVSNQNIHGQPQPEMVIVTHPDFLPQAEELAQVHFEESGLRTLVVTNQQVYNEFSSGNPDLAAIRNMMRMFYNRATSELDMPKYLLLFGDGSYDTRSQKSSNTNYVLTYQSENSVHTVSSFVSDDYYGLLDENEGETTGLLDLGIGRIPSNTVAEASLVVSKIKEYLSASSFGGWHNQLCFIGDDGDGNLHMNQSDQLAQFVEENYPRYNIDKIYFDAYPLVTTSQGARYPGVTEAINNRANQGTLIMNYVGHANARWLAHEKVLMVNDIQLWRNFDRLSLFVTATCEFSRFDDFSYKSAGEHTLFSSRGGSVGLVSTSRVVYANPNFILNRNFFQYVFAERDDFVEGETEKYYRLGDVLRLAKISSGTSINKRNFLLLGDPALKLHYPEVELAVGEINGMPVGSDLDTLKALSRVEVKGFVNGTRYTEDFIGEAEITLFDKVKNISTLSNRGGLPFEFVVRENTIYKGRSSVVNGEFSANFIIPKDIVYSYGSGRFSLFAHNGLITGAGVFEDFIVGGISESIGDDSHGPEMKVFLNDEKFVSGGITDSNPKILIQLVDSSGINTTGVGIGHDLTATITGAMEMSYVLNDYYVAEVDSYQGGRVEYQLTDLKAGDYKAKVKAWDIYNNSSESEINFTVKADTEFKLSHILNYPNPFTESTGFYFEHNQPFDDFDVSIQVFSPSGKLVKTLEYFYPGTGSYRVGPIYWDGLDDFGDRIGRGVYFYRLRVRLSSGKTTQSYQKLVILK